MTFPRVPGHEVVGVVVKVGEGVSRVKVGDRVGRGWEGGHCDQCVSCRVGDFVNCHNGEITGITVDGGYAEYMLAREHSLAFVPENLDAVTACTQLCAGVTVFNGLRRQHVLPPSTVVVQGIGGLGHLAIQFARRMGYRTIALSRGADKRDLALKLGAHAYIDSTDTQAAINTIKQQYGGAAVFMTTSGATASSPYANALAKNGIILALGVEFDHWAVTPTQLIATSGTIRGHAGGTAYDSEQTMLFASINDVKPMTEVLPFSRYEEAYNLMMGGKALFRVVLKF